MSRPRLQISRRKRYDLLRLLPQSKYQKQESTARRRWNYLIFTLCASLYLLPFMRVISLGTDEGLLVYGAVRVANGQVFARDFSEVVGPGTFYWLAAFFKLFGVTFWAAHVCLFLTSLVTGLLMYFLSRRVCRKYQALSCVILAGTSFGMMWPIISHHVDSNCFALMAVACMIVWLDRRTNLLLFTAGALAGVTTCFLQPKGALLLIALVLWLGIQRRRRLASMPELGWLVAGYCSVVAIVADLLLESTRSLGPLQCKFCISIEALRRGQRRSLRNWHHLVLLECLDRCMEWG